jgi:Flp pilus assembly pilin Flp
MSSRIKEFVRDAAGATAVEYSLIAALFVMGTIAGMHALGSPLQNMILVVLNVVNYVVGYVTA